MKTTYTASEHIINTNKYTILVWVQSLSVFIFCARIYIYVCVCVMSVYILNYVHNESFLKKEMLNRYLHIYRSIVAAFLQC